MTMAVMMQVEEGLSQISDPVGDYLPGFHDLRVVGEGGMLKA